MAYKFYHINGQDETNTGPQKHRLLVEGAPFVAGAGWIARAVGFQESERSTSHVVYHEGHMAGAPTLKLAWWYRTIAEEREKLSATSQPNYPLAVLWGIQRALLGIPMPNQTGPDGPPHRFWIEGTYKGKKVASEVVHLGAVDNHISLDVEWELVSMDGPTPPVNPPNPPPFNGTIAEELSKIEQATFAIRQLLRG